IVKGRGAHEPDGDLTARIAAIALEKGLILVTAGPTRNVIRILVPLTAPKSLIDEGLDILEAALDEAAREHGH
ncbi:MAG: 4-aminobutyrate--2-oxoglutarate transaminase, partial [Hyphomicrobiales bacterium]|nr:4-aminobutyrate--2-oxoglutarate transaminase [Hyphomicrobiales bacterium]